MDRKHMIDIINHHLNAIKDDTALEKIYWFVERMFVRFL